MTDLPSRHQSRERALSLLYEAELKGITASGVVEELVVPPDEYAATLVAADARSASRADTLVSEASVGWPLARMAVIDRLVLRLAVAELLMEDGPPVAVVIDEAVELVTTYSTDRSGAFVNGVLSTIAGLVGAEGSATGTLFDEDENTDSTAP